MSSITLSAKDYDAKLAKLNEHLEGLRQIQEAKLAKPGPTQEQLAAAHSGAPEQEEFINPFTQEPAFQNEVQGKMREGDWGKLAAEANSGVFLGGGDELASGLAAAVSAPFLPQSMKEMYNRTQQKAEDDSRDIQNRSPGYSLSARVAGGILGQAGLSRAMPAALINKTLTKAFPLALSATNPVRQLGGKLIGQAGEGAAAGYLTAPSDSERGRSAWLGGLLQPGIFSGAKALGALGRGSANTLSHNRYELGPNDDFVPLPMQGSGTLPSFFRKVVAKAHGSGSIREQSERVYGKALDEKMAAEEGLAQATGSAKNAYKEGRNAIQDRLYDAKNVADSTGPQMKLSAEDFNKGLNQQIDAAFRRQMLNKSLPASTPQQIRDEIQALSAPQANKAMDSVWKNFGFSDIKNNSFKLRPDEVKKNVQAKLDNPSQDVLTPRITKEIDDAFNRNGVEITEPGKGFRMTGNMSVVKNPPTPTGEIEIGGDALMAVRNSLRMKASNMKEEGLTAIEANALRKAAHAIDEQITGQLDDAGKASYRNELDYYAHRRTFDKTIQKTSINKANVFDPEDWLRGSKAYSHKRYARDEAPSQKDATNVMQAKQETERRLQGAVSDAGVFVKTARNNAARQAALSRRDLVPASEHPDVIGAGTVLKQARENAAKIKAMVPGDPSSFEKNYATRILAAPFVASGPAAIGVGASLNSFLNSKGLQRALSGDTQVQKNFAKWLRDTYDPKIKPLVLKGAKPLVQPSSSSLTPNVYNESATAEENP